MNNTTKIFNFVAELERAVLTGRALPIDRVLNMALNEEDKEMQDAMQFVLHNVCKDYPEFVDAILERLMK